MHTPFPLNGIEKETLQGTLGNIASRLQTTKMFLSAALFELLFTPKGWGWWLEQWKAGLSPSSGVSASPSSLESRPLSPAAVTQLLGDGSGLRVWAGAGAEGKGLEVEVVEPGALEWDVTESEGWRKQTNKQKKKHSQENRREMRKSRKNKK